ncbi:MAG: FAD-dependent monooxygenase [Pseudomonadota bacterium]
MQFHLSGFRPGDPDVFEPNPVSRADGACDVAIVGCGPAGLTLATQLVAVGGVTVRLFERKTGPLQLGQADGIACRSMEMFEAFGIAEQVRREAYWVNETSFWRPDSDGTTLIRADRIQDVEDDLSHQPHTILSQARIHDFLLERMAQSPHRLTPEYGSRLAGFHRDDTRGYPITARVSRDTAGTWENVSCRYLVGCDGARSAVRQGLGLALEGESARQLWGVMDVLAVTDFPDIRLKCAVQSASAGSLLIIPREGGYLVRLYIELDTLGTDERAADRNVTAEDLAARARAILAPFTFEVKSVVWCSAYEVGQRVCPRFDDIAPEARGETHPRVFIAGDACHTHSPKAGQGMNVSMADAFNLGWKLASVVRGHAAPTLLDTYTSERQAKARELIDFDREMARLFSRRGRSGEDAAVFQRYFQQHGRYTAGVETHYGPSDIIADTAHQALAAGLVVGKRFHSAPVVRLADAKPMQLAEAFSADGRWRVVAFANASDDGGECGEMAALCHSLTSSCLSHWFQAQAQDVDARIDVRAVFQQSHRTLDIQAMHPLLRPEKGPLGLIDYEKVFCADHRAGHDIYARRGIDRERGAMIVVRPDHYVSCVLPLSDTDALEAFFSALEPCDCTASS